MKTKLQKSIDYIKGFCDKHDACDFCRLQSKETKKCVLECLPVEWEYNEHENKRGQHDD